MFYIGYEKDGVTACKKQLRGAEYIGKAANGAEIYGKANERGDYWEYYYTVTGLADMVASAPIGGWRTPEEVRGILANTTADAAGKAFPCLDAFLAHVALAVERCDWTSNADALLCELCGKPDLAAKVRANRAAYKARQAKEEQQREAAEEQRRKEEAEAEQKRKAEELEQAEQNLRAGKFITAAHFEQLAEKYNVSLPIKFVGWLREWCGSICLKTDTEYGGYRTQYYLKDKRHKSTSIGTYGDKLGRAMAI